MCQNFYDGPEEYRPGFLLIGLLWAFPFTLLLLGVIWWLLAQFLH
jgi:hypothetical protein